MAASKKDKEKVHAEFVACVVGLSRGPEESFSSHQGIGKSCLCYRFLYPGMDEYEDDHQSILALHEFESYVINNDHFLYWGSIVKHFPVKGSKSLHAAVRVHVIEQTVFYQDETSRPFKNSERYIKRLLGPLDSPGKVSYKSRNSIDLSSEAQQFPSKLSKVPRGFMVVLDVSLYGSEFNAHLQRTEQLLDYLAKHKQKFIIVATKRDDSNQTSLRYAHELRRKYRTILIETSASGNKNIRDAFRLAASKVIKKPAEISDSVTSFEEANHRSLIARGHVKQAFQAYLKKQVTDPEYDVQSLCEVPEYIECKKLTGGFDTGWLFATHIMEVYNAAYSSSNTTDTRQEYLENFVKQRSDLSSYIHHLKSWIDFHVDEDQSDDNIEEHEQEEEEEVKRDAKSHVSTPHSNLVWLTIADSPPKQGQETLEAASNKRTAMRNSESPHGVSEGHQVSSDRDYEDVDANPSLPPTDDSCHGNGKGSNVDVHHDYEPMDYDTPHLQIQGQSTRHLQGNCSVPHSPNLDARPAALLFDRSRRHSDEENYTKFHLSAQDDNESDSKCISDSISAYENTEIGPIPVPECRPSSLQVSKPKAAASPRIERHHWKTNSQQSSKRTSPVSQSPVVSSNRRTDYENRDVGSPTLDHKQVLPFDFEKAVSKPVPFRKQDQQVSAQADNPREGDSMPCYKNSRKASAKLAHESSGQEYDNNSEIEQEVEKHPQRSPNVPKKAFPVRTHNRSTSNPPAARLTERADFVWRLDMPKTPPTTPPNRRKYIHSERTDFSRLATPAANRKRSPAKTVGEMHENTSPSPLLSNRSTSMTQSTAKSRPLPVTPSTSTPCPDYVDEDYINTALTSLTSPPKTTGASTRAELACPDYVDEDYVNTALSSIVDPAQDKEYYVNSPSSNNNSAQIKDDLEYDYPDLRKARIPVPFRRAAKPAQFAKVHPNDSRGGKPASIESTELKSRGRLDLLPTVATERETSQPLRRTINTEENDVIEQSSVDVDDVDYINGYVNTECDRQLPSRRTGKAAKPDRQDKRKKDSEKEDFEYDYPDLQRNLLFKFGKGQQSRPRQPSTKLPPRRGNANKIFSSAAGQSASSNAGSDTMDANYEYVNAPSWWLKLSKGTSLQIKERRESDDESEKVKRKREGNLPPRSVFRPTQQIQRPFSFTGSGLDLTRCRSNSYVAMSPASCTLDDCYINWETIYSSSKEISSLSAGGHTRYVPLRKGSVDTTSPDNTCATKTVDLSKRPELPPRTKVDVNLVKVEESTNGASRSISDRDGESLPPPIVPRSKKPSMKPKPASVSVNHGSEHNSCSHKPKTTDTKPALRPKPIIRPKPSVLRHSTITSSDSITERTGN